MHYVDWNDRPKPLIVRNVHNMHSRDKPDGYFKYICHDDYYVYGFGDTPTAAYKDWKMKATRYTFVSRHGIWNKVSCLMWWREHCPRIRTQMLFPDGTRRHIVGYTPYGDKLIFRG
jgi:hypothetical protein